MESFRMSNNYHYSLFILIIYSHSKDMHQTIGQCGATRIALFLLLFWGESRVHFNQDVNYFVSVANRSHD